MRLLATGMPLPLAALIAVAAAPTQPVAAEKPYCPNAAHARPAKVPMNLWPGVATVFELNDDAPRDAAFVRCVGDKLMGCYVGANLNCDKADTRRTLPGATAWCRQNPGSKGVPAATTGHATIYDWSCNGRRAAARNAVLTVDRQGYVADNWKEIPQP
jgi:hypothetical protein